MLNTLRSVDFNAISPSISPRSGAFKVDARDQTADPCMVTLAGQITGEWRFFHRKTMVWIIYGKIHYKWRLIAGNTGKIQHFLGDFTVFPAMDGIKPPKTCLKYLPGFVDVFKTAASL